MIASQGHKTLFYTVKHSYIDLRRESGFKHPQLPENVRMLYIGNRYLFRDVAYPIVNPIREYRDLIDTVASEKVDLIHFYFPEHMICLPMLRREDLGDLPVVLSVNGIPGHGWSYGNKYVDVIARMYANHISLKLIKKADLIIPFSSEVRRVLMSLGFDEDRIASMIAHGVDTNAFRPSDDKIGLRKRLGLPLDAFVIMYAGRLVRVKRLAVLIRSLAGARKTIGDCLLLLAGDGPQRRELEALSVKCGVKQIVFTGFLDQERLSEFYAAADMFALISSGEGIPSALLEACSSGLPSLVSNVGGNSDIIRNGFNGIVLDDVTEASIVQGITAIERDQTKLSENSRRYALEKLKWNAIIAEYIDRYEKLLR
jgi:glycosyltransferase involved in cell wall biosynthesis